jgi:hypothetical protein
VYNNKGSGKNNMKEYERNKRALREKNISVFSRKDTEKVYGTTRLHQINPVR